MNPLSTPQAKNLSTSFTSEELAVARSRARLDREKPDHSYMSRNITDMQESVHVKFECALTDEVEERFHEAEQGLLKQHNISSGLYTINHEGEPKIEIWAEAASYHRIQHFISHFRGIAFEKVTFGN